MANPQREFAIELKGLEPKGHDPTSGERATLSIVISLIEGAQLADCTVRMETLSRHFATTRRLDIYDDEIIELLDFAVCCKAASRKLDMQQVLSTTYKGRNYTMDAQLAYVQSLWDFRFLIMVKNTPKFRDFVIVNVVCPDRSDLKAHQDMMVLAPKRQFGQFASELQSVYYEVTT